MKRASYSSEVKWKCVELKVTGLSTKEIVEKYIKNYNENRIQQKSGYLSPIEYRKQAA